ncbi:ATP-dependent zinc protease [Kiloniella antarctica]|uniref:ATP-dependent zinc protease n=1 Tax=Kiloniella antarctica TaxID=1550907 RepID=A0ABW5BIN8_9PROT
MRSNSRKAMEIGWREYVSLPEFHLDKIKAKIDSGARTSALHAEDITVTKEDGVEFVSFLVPVDGCPKGIRCKVKVTDKRPIKNTSGVPEERYIVETILILGDESWPIEVSLTNRLSMRFPLIIGRAAIRDKHFLLNPGGSYLAGRHIVFSAPKITRLKKST